MPSVKRTRTLVTALAAVALLAATAIAAHAEQRTVTAQAATSDAVLTGFTRAQATMTLVAEATGRLVDVAADIGDAVGGDGVFARVDPTFILLDLDENRVQQDKLAARIAYDAKEAARYRELVARGTAPQSTLDSLEQTLTANRHELDALRVAEKVLRERLARTRITAPAGWLVSARSVEPGQWVTSGQTVGAAGDYSTLVAPFALTPEQYDALARRKGELRLRLPQLDTEVRATIHSVNPGFDPVTRKINVELAVSEGLPERRGGLRTELTLRMPDPAGGVLLPPDAVVERYEEHWVRREDGSEVKVVLLGNHGGENRDLLRVTSPDVSPGERFLAGWQE